ncbi:DUF4270 domain-containing protein [Bacteroidales bacterium OttesenSCG-928-C03]|nr:DUF4270 domain-containing protein [Bacteroidales bacterium OttesenSCG-928-E04]MDL2309293.1 DUF4270 domain-containing protein [Bacteroidales bacterium OttesenSCG-928-C03]MDL2325998.1 DUF4270 domain-containing protein [Bacteroidales bacterium OttesenSCG-928-A14]
MGLNLKGNDYLGNAFTDSLIVKAYSMPDDSVATNGLNNVILGLLHDPVFGKTTSSFSSQFALPTFGHSFGENVVLDSVVLTLALSGHYGDTTSTLYISVRELSESILDNTTYYSSDMPETYAGEIAKNGMVSVKPKPNTKVVIDTNTYDPHIRIPLTEEFGYKLLRNDTYNASNELFKTFFKGLCIDAQSYSSTGCLLYINPNSSLSAITLYYKDNDTTQVSRRYVYSSAKQNYFSHFEHALRTSNDQDFISQVIDGNQDLGKEVLYIKPMAGVKTHITFPNLLETFKGKNIIINRAELILTNTDPDEDLYLCPANLSLTTEKDGNTSYILDDPNYSSSNTSTYYGGNYNSKSNEYRFRITKHIQYIILNESEDLGLYVTTRGNGIRSSRLIFKGTDPFSDNEKRLRLEIYYTTY